MIRVTITKTATKTWTDRKNVVKKERPTEIPDPSKPYPAANLFEREYEIVDVPKDFDLGDVIAAINHLPTNLE